uniref:Uncharacterized protein n=1 Tax=Glossina pallidipes TaxID=7398 RepID=A0A1B0AAS0_GLOPL
MLTDAQLAVFSNFIGVFLLLLVVLYHYVNASCKTNLKTKFVNFCQSRQKQFCAVDAVPVCERRNKKFTERTTKETFHTIQAKGKHPNQSVSAFASEMLYNNT